ncbi:polymorphic toxin-type HINT domain-containing protein [Kitasatospora sp. NPDC085879]|uniref:polymorphic toxin-type HINT domain-containing protein n=1 Tax=Kitasatospora sp. NPDC085879 TaxID=3154769 RepID=UPI003417EBA6
MISALISAPAAVASPAPKPPLPGAPQAVAVNGVHNYDPKTTPPSSQAQRAFTARATKWPKAAKGSAHLSPSEGKADGAKQTAAGTPVWLQASKPATGVHAGPADVGVTVLDHQRAAALGVSGMVFTLDPSTAGDGKVRVGVDYSSFAEAYGGNYASRLHLVSLPACALTTPEVAACRVQTPLPSQRDAKASSVSADVELKKPSTVHASTDAAAGGAVPAVWHGEAATAVQTAAPSGAQVLAVTGSGDEGGSRAGNYTASALSPAGSWTAGSAGGSFSYGYPIQIPGASTTLTPKVSLGYDSASVDGKTASTQAQASWVGDGWSMPDSYIEQTFTSCSQDPEGSPSPSKIGDQCYAGPILTLSLNGSSTALVWDSGKNTWKPQSDNGEIVTRVPNANNGTGTYNTDYWTVTDRFGTTYYFGRNQLPGWTSGKPVTNSVDSVPVYSAHSGDPCYNAAGFNSSVCTMAYKWHLDYVKDVRGQAMSYWYTQDTNYYAQNKGQSNTKYVRDSYLSRIDYGFLDNGAFGTVPDQINFTTGSRCVAATCDPISASNAGTQYPDVPFDLICNSGTTCTSQSPSFFSTVRLKQISTTQYSTAAGKPLAVDTYDLAQTEPPTGDGTSPTLWLASVTRTGNDTTAGGTGAIALPPVVFGGTTMQNRVDTTNFPGMYRYRLTSITTELGAQIDVEYGLPNPCTAGYVASANASTNTSSCFPVRWTPEFYTDPVVDWFQKYAVTKIVEKDQTGGAPGHATFYEYGGGAAWHYDDNEIVNAKYRTWAQFRGYADVTTRVGDGTDRRTKQKTTYYRGMDGDWLSPTSTRSVVLTDSQGATHADSDALSGRALESTSYKGDGNTVDNLDITSYWISAATATRNRAGLPALNAAAVKEAESYSRQAVTSTTPTSWQVTEADNTYVADTASPTFGLLTASYSHTVPAAAAYDTCTTYSYAPVNTGLNLVGLVASQEKVSVACGGFTQGSIASAPAGYNTLTAPATVDRPAQVQSAARTFYDDPQFATDFPQAKPPTVGNVTMVQTASDHTGAGGAFVWQTSKRTTYDAYGRPLTATDGMGNTTTTTYTVNAVGLTTASTLTNAKNQTATTTLAPARGLTVAASDVNNITATSQSDALGRLTAVWTQSRATTAPANLKFAYTVSSTGLSGTRTDKLNNSLGYATSYTLYDSLGRVRQTQAPTPQNGRLITESYFDTHGWVVKTNKDFWDPNNLPAMTLATDILLDQKVPKQDRITYDGLGRPVRVDSLKNSAVQESTTTVYAGDRTTVVPPTGGTVRTTVTDPLGRTTELDDYTTRPTVTPPADTFNGDYTITGGQSQAVTYGYDGHGKQNTVTANGSTWTTTYNLLGQATAKNDPDAGISTMQYDAAGNLSQSTDSRGKSVSYTYDALNRKTGSYAATALTQSGSNQLASWAWDNDNNGVVGMTNPKGHITTSTSYVGGRTTGAAYTTQSAGFNKFGSSLGDTITIPATAEGAELGKPYVFKHTYISPTGLPDSDIYPATATLPAETILHGYATALDLPNSTGPTSYGYGQSVTYDAYGRPGQSKIGGQSSNYSLITNAYDPHTGSLTDQSVFRSGTQTEVDKQHYDYDQAGNTTRQVSTRLGTTSETQCFTYDQLDRLTQAWTATDSCAATPTTAAHSQVGDAITGGAYWTDWAFDALGNRTSQVEHSTTGGADTTTTYTYNGNGKNQPHTLTAATGGSALEYDTAGNTTKRTTTAAGTQNLTWDDAGRLTTIGGGTAGTSNYVYDADGNVLLQKDPGTTTLYLPGQQIVLDTATRATTATRYIPLPGGGTVVRTGSGTNYKFEISDPHGTAGLILDNTAQTPTWRQFTPYGGPRGATAAWPDNRAFLNAPASTATGLTILGARQYDPVTGRFISLDPIFDPADTQQLGGYNYAASNPVAKSDPTGLCPRDRCDGYGQNPGLLPGDHGDPEDVRPEPQPVPRPAPTKKKKRGFWDGFGGTFVGVVMPLAELGGCLKGRADACLQTLQTVGTNVLPPLQALSAMDTVLTLGEETRDGEYAYLGGQLTATAATVWLSKRVAPAPAAAGVSDGGMLARLINKVRGGCALSFAPATPVLMGDGSAKPIADVTVGDKVQAADPDTGAVQGPELVTATWLNHDNDLVDVTLQTADGTSQIVHTTANHPFWDDDTHSFVTAGALKAGHHLLNDKGTRLLFLAVHTKPGTADYRNLSVNRLHTYYVLAGTTPVLVHNINLPNQGACSLPGLSVHDIPSGSSGGPGAYQTIPTTMRAEYGTGVQWHPPLNQVLCSYCRTNIAKPIDHVEPRINGGDLTDANTTPACTFCNSSKRDRVAPLNPPPSYRGLWPPPWWPANMQATVPVPRTIP